MLVKCIICSCFEQRRRGGCCGRWSPTSQRSTCPADAAAAEAGAVSSNGVLAGAMQGVPPGMRCIALEQEAAWMLRAKNVHWKTCRSRFCLWPSFLTSSWDLAWLRENMYTPGHLRRVAALQPWNLMSSSSGQLPIRGLCQQTVGRPCFQQQLQSITVSAWPPLPGTGARQCELAALSGNGYATPRSGISRT